MKTFAAMSTIFVVGENGQNELVLNDYSEIRVLTECNLPFILTKIHTTMTKTIFIDNANNIWITENKSNLSKFTYFQQKKPQITISKICSNTCGECIFFITNNGEVYGTSNDQKHYFSQNTSKQLHLIPNLQNVIDIKSGFHCSVALCVPSESIWNQKQKLMQQWSTQNKLQIPSEIFVEIQQFHDHNDCFCTDCKSRYNDNKFPKTWNKMFLSSMNDRDEFMINIIKIECGAYHSLLLDSNGDLYTFGYNGCGQLGLGTIQKHDHDKAYSPMVIPYFKENYIKIKDISCGFQHNLALDLNGNVWSWGYNGEGQCGHYQKGYILEPRIIKNVRNLKIVNIGCGGAHSFVEDENKGFYLFGDNSFNECSLMDNGTAKNNVILPQCVNDRFEKLTLGKQIENVFLGSLNTIFTV